MTAYGKGKQREGVEVGSNWTQPYWEEFGGTSDTAELPYPGLESQSPSIQGDSVADGVTPPLFGLLGTPYFTIPLVRNEESLVGAQFTVEEIVGRGELLPGVHGVAPHVATDGEGPYVGQTGGSHALNVTAKDVQVAGETLQYARPTPRDRLHRCEHENCLRRPGFRILSELTKHQRCHMEKKNRRFGCVDCKERFGCPAHLNKHVEAVHQGVRYYCPVCRKDYNRHDARKRHMDAQHRGAPLPDRHDLGVPLALASLASSMQTPRTSERKVNRRRVTPITPPSQPTARPRNTQPVAAPSDEKNIDPQLRTQNKPPTPFSSSSSSERSTYRSVVGRLTPAYPTPSPQDQLKHRRNQTSDEDTSGSQGSGARPSRKTARVTVRVLNTPPMSVASSHRNTGPEGRKDGKALALRPKMQRMLTPTSTSASCASGARV